MSESQKASIGKLTQHLQEYFSEAVQSFHQHRGDETIVVDKKQIVAICKHLRDHEDTKMDFLSDLTAVDYPEEKARFEVVYHLKSIALGHRLRLKAKVEEKECEIDSVHELWKCADWYERECYDMYGVCFKNHPNLKRILMYDSFEGFPLRKDYPVDRQQPLVDMIHVEERHHYERS